MFHCNFSLKFLYLMGCLLWSVSKGKKWHISFHLLSGIKQLKFVILQLWSSEVPNGYYWPINQGVQQGCIPSGGTRQECVSLPFPGARDLLNFLAPSPLLHLQSQKNSIVSSNLSDLLASLFLLKGLLLLLLLHWANLDNLR